eukprot:1159080-Pelagomonas_calceolata.AAC.3
MRHHSFHGICASTCCQKRAESTHSARLCTAFSTGKSAHLHLKTSSHTCDSFCLHEVWPALLAPAAAAAAAALPPPRCDRISARSPWLQSLPASAAPALPPPCRDRTSARSPWLPGLSGAACC